MALRLMRGLFWRSTDKRDFLIEELLGYQVTAAPFILRQRKRISVWELPGLLDMQGIGLPSNLY